MGAPSESDDDALLFFDSFPAGADVSSETCDDGVGVRQKLKKAEKAAIFVLSIEAIYVGFPLDRVDENQGWLCSQFIG